MRLLHFSSPPRSTHSLVLEHVYKKKKLLVHLEKREIVIVSPKFSRIFIFGTEILRKNSKGVAIRIFDSPPVV